MNERNPVRGSLEGYPNVNHGISAKPSNFYLIRVCRITLLSFINASEQEGGRFANVLSSFIMDVHILMKRYKSLVDSTHRNLGWNIKPSFTQRGLWVTVSFPSPGVVIANLVQPSTGHVLELLVDSRRVSVTLNAFCKPLASVSSLERCARRETPCQKQKTTVAGVA